MRILGFSLIPRELKFFDMLENQTLNLIRVLEILLEISRGGIVDPLWARRVNEIEHDGDGITRRLITAIHSTFLTPIDREDIFELTRTIDDVLDLIEEAVKKIVDYEIMGDEELNSLTMLVRESVLRVNEGVACLRKMDGSRLDKITEHMIRCEHEADRLEDSIIGDSYEVDFAEVLEKKDKGEPITVADLQKAMDFYNRKRKRREIAEILERAVDSCRHVFHILGNIRVKYA